MGKEEIKNRIKLAAFQVNLALFILSVCFLDSDGYGPILVMAITGTFLAWFLFYNLGFDEKAKEVFGHEDRDGIR